MAKPTASYTFTDQELLDLYRQAYAEIAVTGQDYMIGSRRFTAADLSKIAEQISWLESRIEAASGGLHMTPVRLTRP